MAERDWADELAWELLYRLWTKGEITHGSAAAELAAVLRTVRDEERERCAAVCEVVAVAARDIRSGETATDAVLREVAAERARQDERWGEQNHPIVRANAEQSLATLGLRTAAEARARLETEARRGQVTYAAILVEEVCEAVEAACESDDAARAELVQVAAVAVAMVEAIDRRASRG